MLNLVSSGKIRYATINLPASKSISNRLLIIRFLSGSLLEIENLSQADDTLLLNNLISQFQNGETVFDVKNAGTVIRFFTALLALKSDIYTIECSERMKNRPIIPLVNALQKLGANFQFIEKFGFPPFKIQGGNLHGSELIYVDSSLSSQFLSALAMIGPYISNGLKLDLADNLVSKPYFDMTLKLMKANGINYEIIGNTLIIPESSYYFGFNKVESDWSAAAFFYEMVALSPNSSLFLTGLNSTSLQGDSKLVELFLDLGVETIFENNGVLITNTGNYKKNCTVDFVDFPDLALPYIATCAGLKIIGKFSGLSTLKHKESDRMQALSAELQKIGVDLRDIGFDEWVLINSCKIEPDCFTAGALIETYDDHRMAMAMAPLVLKTKTLTIDNHMVVSKSFPYFWDEFAKILI